MKWEEQVEPERVEALAELCRRCGLARTLELLTRAQVNDVCVWFAAEARRHVREYLASHRVEAGGLMIGSRFAVPSGGSIVSIEMFTPGTDFEGTGVSLSLGTKVWDDARALLDDGYAVVGWVHSHPNLGAFFSGTDRRTQRAFFQKPWQLGLCVDPIRDQEAWFFGPDSREVGLFVLPSDRRSVVTD